jgi:hypothetical protein
MVYISLLTSTLKCEIFTDVLSPICLADMHVSDIQIKKLLRTVRETSSQIVGIVALTAVPGKA